MEQDPFTRRPANYDLAEALINHSHALGLRDQPARADEVISLARFIALARQNPVMVRSEFAQRVIDGFAHDIEDPLKRAHITEHLQPMLHDLLDITTQEL